MTVTDPLTGLGRSRCTPGTPATLAPGATIHCTATYTVTQADVDAGSIVNSATMNGLEPDGSPRSVTDGASVTATQTASVSLTKTASPDEWRGGR